MAKISLRAYNQEIENLISHGQTDEAIAHCKYILKLFPKHVDTYRLLGKSYLESQHYTEASDILKRVLSVIPDDFVSQIGLSIIREDEGNLDAAIWHMERAFEVQPSNIAIQDELRRLYGRRDGVEPHKVRLTHGALLRLYLRGELFTQAIAEARAALAEDPQRTDIMVILARCYNLSNREIESIEVCSRLLSKLPYCFEANRILSEVLPKTAKPEDAKIYQQRMNSLDPYYGLISSKTPTINQVPDNAISIERLMWQAADGVSQQPNWAQTVGVELENTEEEIPDWMEAIPSNQGSVQESTSNPTTTDQQSDTTSATIFELSQTTDENEIKKQEDSIPEWMRDAGWQEGSKEFIEEQSIFSEPTDEEGGESEKIEQAEIPDWIQALAPSDDTDQIPLEEEKEKLDLLDKILPKSEESSIVQDNVLQSDEALPDWLNAPIEDNLENKINQETSLTEGFSSDTEDQLPDWLSNLQENGQINELESANELPEEFIKSLQNTGDDLPNPADIAIINTSQAKDNLLTGHENSQIEFPEETDILGQNQEELIDNENNLIETAQSDTNPPNFSDSNNAEDLPDWLNNFDQVDSSKTAEDEDLPDWLNNSDLSSDTNDSPSVIENSSSPLTSNPFNEDLLITSQDTSLEWIQETDTKPQTQSETEENESAPDENSEQIGEIEEGLAWLESLAAAHGAEEETLVTSQNERSEEMPEWLKSLEPEEFTETSGNNDSTDTQDQNIISAAPESDLSIQNWHPEFTQAESESEILPSEISEALPSIDQKEEATEIPDLEADLNIDDKSAEEIDQNILEESFNWLESLAAKQGADEESLVSSKEARNDEVPEWLKNLEPEEDEYETAESQDFSINTDSETASFEIDATKEQISSDLILPEKDTAAESVPPVSVDNPFDAAAQFNPELSGENPKGQNQIEEKQNDEFLTEMDDGFAWLESLAAKHGADEETLITPKDESILKPPDWILEAETEDISIEDSITSSETSTEDLEAPNNDMSLEVADAPMQNTKSPSIEDTQPTHLKQATSSDILPDLQPINEENSVLETEQDQIPDWLQGIDRVKEEIVPEIGTLEDFSESDVTEIERLLSDASKALSNNNFNDAFEYYGQAISINKNPKVIIDALSDALYHFPIEPNLWKLLGDAHAQNHQLKEALDAYTKAEELLR